MPETNRDEIAKLEALYASNPEGRVFTHLAEAYRKGGDFDRARAILEQGLSKHPGYASAYVVLGRVFFDLNDMQQATDSFRRVLELDPHNLVALRSLGDIERAAGRNAAALDYFQELRHQDPSNAEIENIIAELRDLPATTVDAREVEPENIEEEAPAAVAEEPAIGTQPESEPFIEEIFQPAVAENLPEFDTPVAEYGDLVTPGLDIDWTTGEAIEEEQPLPGDLANFADLVASAPPLEPVETEAPPELTDLPTLEAEPEPPAWDAGLPSLEDDPSAPTGEVVTETMAQLYRDQGLFERSAEIYRALLRERPNDWALQAGLQEVEMLASGGSSVDADIESPSFDIPLVEEASESESPAVEKAPEPGSFEEITGVASEPPPFNATAPEATPAPNDRPAEEEPPSPWMSPAAPATEPVSIYNWADEERAEEAQESTPIGAYFSSLLSWRPNGNGAQSSFAPAPEVEEEPAVLELDLPADTSQEPMFEEPVLAAEPEPPQSPPAPELPPVPEPPAIPPDELMPWEEPASPSMPDAPVVPPTAPAPPNPRQPPQSSADNPVDEAFDAWFNSASPAGTLDIDPMPAAAAPALPAAPSPDLMEPQTSGPTSDSEDDDDLEMFRSWLQSLKK